MKGRKNWRFSRADFGGRPAAAICSPIKTAKLNVLGLDANLHDVIAQMVEQKISRIDETLARTCAEGSDVTKNADAA